MNVSDHVRYFAFALVLSLANPTEQFSGDCVHAGAFEWQIAEAEELGASRQRLVGLQNDLARRNTNALLVIHNDRIVCEWYAAGHGREKPHYSASMAKALVGGVALAVAIDDGRIALDDPVAKFVPQWTGDPRKSRITIRQLGSHTSGLADAEADDLPHEQLTGWQGDFWKRLEPPRDPFTISRDLTPLVFEPGANRQYSNPGIAMLGYAVTAALRDAPERDLRTLLRERIMRPIGVPDDEWSCGYGKTFVVDGLPLVGAWGGGGFTARAAARVGRLMLRQGDWDGRQLVAATAIRQTTHTSGLPGDGGIGWWTNAGARVPALPADAFWAAGAGGQVLLVVPSLQLIVVRNGGNLDDGDNDVAVAKYFFTPLMQALQPSPGPSPGPGEGAIDSSPGLGEGPGEESILSKPSSMISYIEWAPADTVLRRAKGSDNWPITWADDDALYTAYGDGRGFEPFVPEKLSLGLAKISGSPPEFQGLNHRAPSVEAIGDGQAARKASGLVMIDGVLYLLVRNVANSQLAWSADHGETWKFADWKFTDSFGAPAFINFGRNYAGARDEFVYVVSHDADSAYEVADGCVLARAAKHRLPDHASWEYFAGYAAGQAQWSSEIADRKPILRNPGKCYRTSISYNAPLRRYLLVHPVPSAAARDAAGKPDTRFAGGLAIYDAPEPWGPWTTAYFTDIWDIGPGETCSFPTKWMSADGKTLYMVFSGNDCFSVRQGTLAIDKPSR
jgi:CubicO group peptidase (beta-lactamase class C family)